MSTNPLIRSIRLENVLSFGSPGVDLELGPLNVLIGPNASGKSNLIEVFGLLQAAPRDLPRPIREGGGVSEWLWKGASPGSTARIEVVFDNEHNPRMGLRYILEFGNRGQAFDLIGERLENESAYSGHKSPYFYFSVTQGRGTLNLRSKDTEDAGAQPSRRELKAEDLEPNQSVLAQRKDPDQYPEITFAGRLFARYRLYREWNLGRYTPPRLPQKPDLAQDFLQEDAGNLALVLNDLEHRGQHAKLSEYLRRFCDEMEGVSPGLQGGTIQLFLRERGPRESILPATRLSDGTLRYLCLLSILCHPDPPPLVCIEEPELGLHPDIIPAVAELLVEASSRTQLVVTTHSDVLVDAFSDRPEAVVVCERGPAGTTAQRLDRGQLQTWLEDYRLGALWRKGELGGVRW